MFRSMTAFGRARNTVNGKDITIEMRSVNNRFFDCSVKLPRQYGFLEENIKSFLQKKGIARGKVDVFVTINVIDSGNTVFQIDEGYARNYLKALQKLRDTFSLPDDISTMKVAQNPYVLVATQPDEKDEEDWLDVQSVLETAVDIFLEGRLREGRNLEKDLCQKMETIRGMVDKIEQCSENQVQTYRERLSEKIREALKDNQIDIDESRLLTECAIYADKVAIDEELVRLRSHFDLFDGIVRSSDPAGRKLDFLLQDMNRETNTIGSKCNDAAIAHLVIDLKTEMEKVREQIQNIE